MHCHIYITSLVLIHYKIFAVNFETFQLLTYLPTLNCEKKILLANCLPYNKLYISPKSIAYSRIIARKALKKNKKGG